MEPLILIAEPSAKRREQLIDAFEAAGMRCLTASNGSEALAVAARYTPKVLVLTAELEEVQGTDVCLRIKQETPGTKVILLSSNENSEERFVADEVGADRYLPAGQPTKALIDLVREVLASE